MKINKINISIADICKKVSKIIMICIIAVSSAGCNDFLDVVPDNIANLDHVFANKKEAERYMATLYSYAPSIHSSSYRTLSLFGADDVWTYAYDNNYSRTPGLRIAMGEQSVTAPLENYWDNTMFKAIRDCNVFIEEVSKTDRVPDLDMATRNRWLAEANFLKAYYHFILFRMYGPIPITDKNTPVGTEASQVLVKRNTVDEVINYISDLLDEAIGEKEGTRGGLPLIIQNAAEEAGRVTIGAAYMLKARLWATAASPLFNGNPDYKGYADHDGVMLFPQKYDQDKWNKTIEACEKTLANIPGVELYTFTEVPNLSDKTKYQMNLRGAITDRFNKEIIWGRYMDDYLNKVLQGEASVPQMIEGVKNGFESSCFSVTLNMVERFYTKNGVPIDEDKTWTSSDYPNRYAVRKTDEYQKYNLIVDYNTAILNQNRENRFYASLMFDGSVVYMKNVTSEEKAHQITTLLNERNGISGTARATVTGYWIRKLINWEYAHSPSGVATRSYSWPEMRLADLKLLYAEALNEVDRMPDAIKQIDDVRARSGLDGVVESWQEFSVNPTKPNTQDGLREIIHQEREIELAFEGHRIWDMRRWKKAVTTQNKDVRGWYVKGKDANEYYKVMKLHEQTFIAPRDYLWPISLNATLRNPKLVQNPGWN